MKKAVVVLSGGLDSSTVLAQCIEMFGKDNVMALVFYYGQRHSREVHAASEVCRHYEVQFEIYDISAAFAGIRGPLFARSEESIPEGTYESQGEAPATEVPFRNGIFLSIAASYAMAHKYDYVYCGVHQDDDRAAYADTSPSFFDGMSLAVAAGTHQHVILRTPFLDKNKVDIVKEGARLKIPFHLTWSCYNGGEKPCGKCGTCIQRATAFKRAGIKDPILSE